MSAMFKRDTSITDTEGHSIVPPVSAPGPRGLSIMIMRSENEPLRIGGVEPIKDSLPHEHGHQGKYQGSQIDSGHRHQETDIRMFYKPASYFVLYNPRHGADARGGWGRISDR
jgi:hypothetical protein